MSQAYQSTLNISFDVRGGLMVRQIHHWAADLFMAAVMAHMLRVWRFDLHAFKDDKTGNPRATTIVAVIPGLPKEGAAQLLATLHRDFASVQIAATARNSAHVTNQEEGGHIYLCQGPVRPWGLLWPPLRHYN